jgi:signal transduction histidine kinase
MQAAEFQQFYGILPEPMLLVSGGGVVFAANETAGKLIGSAPVTGVTTLRDLVEDPPERIARSLSQWGRTRALSPSALTLKRPGGSSTHVRAEGALVKAGTEPAETRIVLRLLPRETTTERFLALNERIEALNKEIAERQRAEAALAHTIEELRRANADLEQFAYSASHDLREPLRMIAIYSDLLKRRLRGKIDEKSAEYLNFTVQGAKRMEALIHDLLAYTQAVSLSTDSIEPVSADSVLDLALANLRHAIEESRATIHRGPLPALSVQQVHLLQIFQNLIGNSLKYRSQKLPDISIAARREGRMWRISVHDNGIGIAPQYAEQVFRIFKRLHAGDKYTGTGVGLAICHKIVQRYGGRIWVDSDGRGNGCAFHFTLPAAEVQPLQEGALTAAD